MTKVPSKRLSTRAAADDRAPTIDGSTPSIDISGPSVHEALVQGRQAAHPSKSLKASPDAETIGRLAEADPLRSRARHSHPNFGMRTSGRPRAPRRRTAAAALSVVAATIPALAVSLMQPPTANAALVTANSTITRAATSTTTVLATSFPPPAGSILLGWSEDSNIVLAKQVGRPGGIDREYFQAGEVAAMAAYATIAASRGSVPLVSIKPPTNWQAIAAGQSDAWLRDIIGRLNAIGRPVLWTINHEPENDTNGTTQTAASFKAMCERVAAMQPAGSLVKFGPVLMSGKYNPIPTPNASTRLKVTDWVSAKSGQYFGFDAYNHFDPTSGKPWRSVSDTFDWMVNGGQFRTQAPILGLKDVDPNKPIVVAEYGTREDPKDLSRAPKWMREFYKYSLAQHLAGTSWFSSANNVNDGGSTWKLSGARLEAFKTESWYLTSVLMR